MATEAQTMNKSRRKSENLQKGQTNGSAISQNHFDEDSIDLVELLFRLLEKIKFIILAALLGALLSGIYTFLIVKPEYQATSKLYVLNSDDSALNLSDLQIGTYLANDYQQVFKNWLVHEQVINNLGLDYSYTEISKMLTITNPDNTRILNITVTASSPEEAAAIADEYAHVAQEFIESTMETEQPNIFEPALKPSRPSAPNKTQNMIMGFLLGIVISCGVIIVQFVFDDRIRTSDDVKKYLKYPCLGIMPLENTGSTKK